MGKDKDIEREKIHCTVRIEFDAAHRVIGHEHKCKYLHGHRYVLELTASSLDLDDLGRVVDFGRLKLVTKEWIDKYFDHNVIISNEDKELGEYINKYTKQNVYYLPYNPTAENIAKYLKYEIIKNLFKNEEFDIEKVKLYETPNCFVEV